MELLLLVPRPKLVVNPIGPMEDKMVENVKIPIKYGNEEPRAFTTNIWARGTTKEDMAR